MELNEILTVVFPVTETGQHILIYYFQVGSHTHMGAIHMRETINPLDLQEVSCLPYT